MAIKIMRIITRMIVGGAQENVTILSKAFNKDGYETLLVSGPETGEEGSLQHKVKNSSVEYKIIPFLLRDVHPVNDLRALKILYRIMKDYNPDIVHTHSSKAGFLGRVAAKLAGVPKVYHTVHGWGFYDDMSFLKRRIFILSEQLAEKVTDCLITVSDLNTEKGLKEKIGTPNKYTTIHSGVDIDFFQKFKGYGAEIRKEFNIGLDEVLVGTVGRLSPQKAPLEFVESIRLISKTNRNIKVIIVGDGPLKNEVLNKLKEFELENVIFLAGLRDDVPKFMDAFDIFVLSSHWEGLPRVFAEAMAMSTPVVATNVDGAPQAIKEGKNGFLVSVGDVETIANRVSALIDNQELRISMGQNGLMLVKQFSHKEMIKKVRKLYDESFQ